MSDLIAPLQGKHLVRGELLAGSQPLDVFDPAKGVVFAQAVNGTAEEVDQAVQVSAAAQRDWAAMKAADRAALLMKLADHVAAHAEDLAQITARETGKAIGTEARGEAGMLPSYIRHFAGLAGEVKGETIPFDPGMLTFTVREPMGVVGAILPWNVPLVLFCLKAVPALACGNGVVVKPSELSPFGGLYLGQLFNDILPKGLVNVVTGDRDTGAALVDHKDVAKISFTGSVAAGRAIGKAAADRLIPATLELGGKSPMLIYGDADIDAAIEGAVAGMRFTRAGQSCTAASRIYVHDHLKDDFVAGLKAELDDLVIGDPLDDGTHIGPLISETQLEKVQAYVAMGEKAAAQSIKCGALPEGDFAKGYFHPSTLFVDVPEDSAVMREEIFGPVTCINGFSDDGDVMRLANDSDFGLAASIWTKDLSRALQAAKDIKAGYVQINQNMVIQPGVPFGGMKQSGLGRESSLEAMIAHFTELKTVVAKL